MSAFDEEELLRCFFESDPTLPKDLEAHRTGDSHRLLRRLETVQRKTAGCANEEKWSPEAVHCLLKALVKCYIDAAESIKISRAVEKLWQPYSVKYGQYIKKCLEDHVMSIIKSKQIDISNIAKVSVLLEQNKSVQEIFKRNVQHVTDSLAAYLSPLMKLSPLNLTPDQAQFLYATVKISIQLFQVCGSELGILVWEDDDSESTAGSQHVKSIVESLIHILQCQGYQTDCVLLCGTAVALILNSCRHKEHAVHVFHWLLHQTLLQEPNINIDILKSCEPQSKAEQNMVCSKLKELTSRHIGPVALIRGMVSCGNTELLFLMSGRDQLPLFDVLLQYITVLCKGDITLHYQAFQILLLWYTRLSKIPSSLESSVLKSNFISTLESTLDLVMLNWDSPVEDVPEAVVDVFTSMMTAWQSRRDKVPDFPEKILQILLSTQWYVKGKYRILAALLKYVSANQVLLENRELQIQLLQCLTTNHLASSATNVYKSFLQQIQNEENWKTLWLQTLTDGLINSNSLLRYNTSLHWIPVTLKQLPNTSTVLQEHFNKLLEDPDTPICRTRLLHAWVVVAKMVRAITGEMNLDHQNVREALCSADENVRSDAISLVCTTLKKAECISKTEVDLLQECLPHNIKIDSAPFRQHLGSDLRKLLVRLRDSCITLLKSPDQNKDKLDCALDFVDWLHRLCIDCLSPGACYQRRKGSLDLLHVMYESLIYCPDSKQRKGFVPGSAVKLLEFSKSSSRWEFFSAQNTRSLILCLLDGADEIQSSAYLLLTRYYNMPLEDKMETPHRLCCHLLEEGLRLCNSPKGHEGQSGAMLCKLVFQKYAVQSSTGFTFKHSDGTNTYTVAACEDKSKAASHQFLISLLEEVRRCLTESDKNLVKASKQYPIHGLIAAVTQCLTDTEDLWINPTAELLKMSHDLMAVCQLIIEKMLNIMAGVAGQEACPSFAEIGMALENLLLENQTDYEESTSLSPEYQYMLSWCWNNIRESCTSLGEVTNIYIESASAMLLSEVQSVSTTFHTVLTKCRHKGVIEGCRTAYIRFCSALLKSNDEQIVALPGNTLTEVLMNLKNRGISSSVTRRSAGLPIIIQAVLVSEKKLKKTVLLNQAVNTLFETCELPLDKDLGLTDLPQVHGLNILNSLFSDASLVGSLIGQTSHAVILVIQQFGSPSWAIRNAATRFFSTLVTKIFGQKKTADDMLCNSVTFKELSSYYPELPPFILKILKEASDRDVLEISNIHPGLFPALTLLSHLKPLDTVDKDFLERLQELRNLVHPFKCSPVYHLRNLVASALVAMVTIQEMTSSVTSCLQHVMSFKKSPKIFMNEIHGNLLYIFRLVDHMEREDDLETLWHMLHRETWLLMVNNGLVSAVYVKILNRLLLRCQYIVVDEILEYLVIEQCNSEGAQVVGDSVSYDAAVDFLFTSYHRNQLSIQGLADRLMCSPCTEVRKSCLCKLEKHEYQSLEGLTVMSILCKCLVRETDVQLICVTLKLIHRLYQAFGTLGRADIYFLSDWFTKKFTEKLACRDSILATVLPVQAILIKETKVSLPKCIQIEAFCSTVYRFSQEVNETLRLSAVQSLQTSGRYLLEIAKVGENDHKWLTNLLGACLTLIQDEDIDIRQEACSFISSLEWCEKPTKFSSFHSNVCFELFLQYITDNFWHSSQCVEYLQFFMCSGPVKPPQLDGCDMLHLCTSSGSVRKLLTERASTKYHQLFDQEDNSFFAEKLYNAFVVHNHLKAILLRCLQRKEDSVLYRLKDEKFLQKIEHELDFIISILNSLPSGLVINICSENAVLPSICSFLLVCDTVSMATNCKPLQQKIFMISQSEALPYIVQRNFSNQLSCVQNHGIS